VLPNVIVKEEDRSLLRKWQKQRGVKVHVWHAFYDLAFGISFDKIETLIRKGLIEPKEQVFQAPGGATTTKRIYQVYYHYAYRLAESVSEPKLVASHIDDKNGHILPYVRFQGGEFRLTPEAREVLSRVAAGKIS
jgi:hypothetical protein